jgi:hypothetical protein
MAILPANHSPNCVMASLPSFSATRDKADRIGEGEAVGLDEDGGKLGVRLVVFGARRDRTHCISSAMPSTFATNMSCFANRTRIRFRQIGVSSSCDIHAVPASLAAPPSDLRDVPITTIISNWKGKYYAEESIGRARRSARSRCELVLFGVDGRHLDCRPGDMACSVERPSLVQSVALQIRREVLFHGRMLVRVVHVVV